jgi:biopolymer transport protein ExbD
MVAPNAIKLLLPKATGQTLSKQTTTVSITEDKEYYVEEEQVPFEQLSAKIAEKTKDTEQPTVVLRVDKNVPVDDLVKVMSIGNELEVRMILATKPKQQ